MKGTISEMELASFPRACARGAAAEGAAGRLGSRVPIGYVKGPDDRIEKDPDARRRALIDLIFRKVCGVGQRAAGVLSGCDRAASSCRSFAGRKRCARSSGRPAIPRGAERVEESGLRGAYAYGRSKTIVRLEARAEAGRRPVQRRREDWAVLILDHHEGYIDWDAYQSNQTMIAHNDNARGNAVRGSIKHGERPARRAAALWPLWRQAVAQYPGATGIPLSVLGHLLNRDHACCVMFGGLRADRLVSEQLLQCLDAVRHRSGHRGDRVPARRAGRAASSRSAWHWSTRAMK